VPSDGEHHQPLLSKLSEAANAVKAQQQLLQRDTTSCPGSTLRRMPSRRDMSSMPANVPVVYQQWHPEVCTAASRLHQSRK
jgi:hypothetical protein